MDRYNECLISRGPGTKDYFLKALVLALTVTLVALSIITSLTMYPMLLIVGVGACYLGYLLMGMTNIEYEYIVTNSDLDVDKIIGKRKRKRLISVKLNTVEALGEYTGTEVANVNATVIATDNTGVGMWYIIAEHSAHGKVMVLFTPSKASLMTMNLALPRNVRKKELEAKEQDEQTSAETNDNVDEKAVSDTEIAADTTDTADKKENE